MTDSLTEAWEYARRFSQQLDARNGTDEHEHLMRLLKVVEEAGEAAQAYLGMAGQNPRKGVTHERRDVATELCDVIMAAMVALHGFDADPAVLLQHVAEDRAVRPDVGEPSDKRETP